MVNIQWVTLNLLINLSGDLGSLFSVPRVRTNGGEAVQLYCAVYKPHYLEQTPRKLQVYNNSKLNVVVLIKALFAAAGQHSYVPV